MINGCKCCWVCGKTPVELHHIFKSGNRKHSDEDGLTVWLCPEHHRGTNGVHGKNGNALRVRLEIAGQRKFETQYPRAEFIARYGRSYIEGDD